MSLFKLRGDLPSTTSIILGVVGLVLFIVVWWLLAEAFAVEVEQDEILPDTEQNETIPTNDNQLQLVDVNPNPDLLPEGSLEGTLVPVRVQVQGLDSTDQVYFTMTDNSQGALQIHPSLGQVSVVDGSQIDYERTTNLNLTINVSTADGRTGSANFNVQVEDRNEFPIGTVTDVNSADNDLRKGTNVGQGVGITAFAEDQDGTDQVSYRLSENPRGIFGINSGTGEIYLKDTTAIMRQAEGTVSIGVIAQSEDGSSNSANFSVSILPPLEGGTKGGDKASKKVYPILPTPSNVIQSYPSLIKDDELVKNTLKSIWLNFKGYFWAVLISIPIGFLIGLFPIFRGMFSKQVDALRYLPLTALTGLFIIWFGIEDEMKVSFLAFGIIVYLLPVVVQRIDEVNSVYTKTVFTLGATDWQTIKTVFLPSVLSKLIDDIRVLTAISWTYIIIAELLNRQGGYRCIDLYKSSSRTD